MSKRKSTRVKVVKKGAHHVDVVKHFPKGSLRKYLTKKRDVEQLAILERAQRIADLASEKVKGSAGVKRRKFKMPDIKARLRKTFGKTCYDSEGLIKGHRVAVWEVLEVHRETKSIAKTADHFNWHPSLVRVVLEYAKAHPRQIQRFLVLERLAKLGTTTLDLSKMTTKQLERMLYELESGEPS